MSGSRINEAVASGLHYSEENQTWSLSDTHYMEGENNEMNEHPENFEYKKEEKKYKTPKSKQRSDN